ncbi:MAG: flagellar basal body L-ring protein FlgH [Candidatus Brocadiaceae bacterium]|nr:flagellar basal body L-ring protein FlgH [Candidatus Brocadiaceae bacterium]
MTKFYTTIIIKSFVTLLIFTVVCDCVLADSLWKKRVTINYNLFDDNRAKRIGDIVTVFVSESTNIDNSEQATTNNSNSASGSADYNKFFRGMLSAMRTGRNTTFDDRPANTFETDFSSSFSGKGDYDSSRSVNLTITAMIVEVLDNGNLVLEGKRNITVNKEKYLLKLTGIARPIDITTINTIASSKMSNVTFGLEGKGWLTRAGSKGWYNRFKDMIWPF